MSESTLRIAFAGTPDLAAVTLARLLNESNIQIELIMTQPDRPSGRGRKLIPGPVKQLALENHLIVEQASHAADIDLNHALEELDVLIVAAYGMILPEAILNRPKYGSLNVHTSLLPRWRGAAPIQRSIQAGDTKTGVSIMQMDAGLDTGAVLLQKECHIEKTETSSTLHDKLALLGADAVSEVLKKIGSGILKAKAQDDTKATYAKKITKAEAELDWNLDSVVLERKIRAFNPTPVCFTNINDQAMRIWQASHTDSNQGYTPGTLIRGKNKQIEVACKNGSLILETIQIPGKKAVSAKEFLNGRPDFLTPTQHA